MLNLNPAFTGFFNGDYRFGGIFRTQWQAVPVPYTTTGLSADARFRPESFKRDALGVGLQFNNDRAGDTRYVTNQIYLSGSYIFLAKRDSSFLISAGANIGFCRVGFDYNRMTFDNQFDGTAYNSGLATGENFTYTQYNFGDFNFGLGTQYIFKQKHRFNYGIAFYHINQPVISYMGNDKSRLDFKLSNYLAYSTPIAQKLDLVAELLFNKQAKYYEVIPHAGLKYFLDKNINQSISAGLMLRARDAIIFRMGYSHKLMQAGISYDINTSRFTAATNKRGAFEIFINYIILKPNKFIVKKKPCPVFM